MLLRRFGAFVTLVRPAAIVHPDHYCNVAERLACSNPGSVYADQFETTSNYRAHEEHTGPEIWRQTRGRVDAFVMSAGMWGCAGFETKGVSHVKCLVGARFTVTRDWRAFITNVQLTDV